MENENIKKLVKKQYINNIDEILEEEELYEPLLDMFMHIRPQTKEGEKMVFENFEVLDITDNEIIMCGGGDWQTPVKFSMYIENSEIRIKKISNTFEESKYSDDEIISKIFDVEIDDWYEYFENYK